MENTKLKVYYAHFMGLYDTKQEKRDIKNLEALGFEVVNPNSKVISEWYQGLALENQTLEEPLQYEQLFSETFGSIVRGCDVLAYRALPDGRISGGVAMEIEYAQSVGNPVICLPNTTEIIRNKMTGAETRAYLIDMGLR